MGRRLDEPVSTPRAAPYFDMWWAAALLIIFAAVLYLWAALVNMPPDHPRTVCVPAAAVDYRGDLDAWVDAHGDVVLYAPAEDEYLPCS